MGLFGKTQTAGDEWSLKIRKEMRVDREIRDIQREKEKKMKDTAKKGQKNLCVVLAKELIRSTKAVSKLNASKAHMNSCVTGSLPKSTEVMKVMQSLVKIPEIQATVWELSKEMMKAGIIEEMLEDTFECMDDQEKMEEAAEMEIDKLFVIIAGVFGQSTPSEVSGTLPESEPLGVTAASEKEEALEAMLHSYMLPSWALKL
uniref:Charged multivesicular body protein 3 n=1 Tax=Myotis lucifugus TaxID=59463 RepID=G1QAL8_MYOLU